MRKIIFLIIALASMSAAARNEKGDYLNPSLPVETRVTDLLGRMTVEEKVGQLLCPLGWEMYSIRSRKHVEVSDTFKSLLKNRCAGMLWAVYRADPWTRKTIDNGLTPRLAAMAGNALQKYTIENTRLGIPMFIAEEAPHGHMAIGATVFPTGIGMAATWNPALIEQTGKVIASEIRSQGAHISYGPVLDLARDPRWSRVEETMGEDPALSGIIGAAMVKGLGGGQIKKPDATIATLKHFLAYAVPEGGQNGNYSTVGTRDLFQYFLPPFRMAVDAGALSIMTSYNSIDGVPCTSNRSLLTDLLRNQWHFRGFTVSDLYSIDGLYETHHVAPTRQDAAMLALRAGVDVDLGADAYLTLVSAVRDGKISESELDGAVASVLRLKFEMGLFENPYVDPAKAEKLVGSPENSALAREVARQSITLLENRGVTLPLDLSKTRIAIVGPNADTPYNQLGDYTAPQPDGRISTLVSALRNRMPDSRLEYVKGCAVRDTTSSDIAAAVDAARRADVVIAVVGGSSARDFKTSYKETGAAEVDATSLSDMESGEGYDRTSLSLLGDQMRMLKALKATGKPLVVVYIEGRPLDKCWAAENADALLTAYYPGQEGGEAIADIISG
ncbi:MAG: glycoside hydrolase family 3 C-terminal domain-containing protein, partial [Paramuribaculum sp.]|nr:glycoside hydrolase family 3 C-terminal domain-containing protein [Paramuribaculum sp.]